MDSRLATSVTLRGIFSSLFKEPLTQRDIYYPSGKQRLSPSAFHRIFQVNPLLLEGLPQRPTKNVFFLRLFWWTGRPACRQAGIRTLDPAEFSNHN
jgi:hypothetical protein